MQRTLPVACNSWWGCPSSLQVKVLQESEALTLHSPMTQISSWSILDHAILHQLQRRGKWQAEDVRWVTLSILVSWLLISCQSWSRFLRLTVGDDCQNHAPFPEKMSSIFAKSTNREFFFFKIWVPMFFQTAWQTHNSICSRGQTLLVIQPSCFMKKRPSCAQIFVLSNKMTRK